MKKIFKIFFVFSFLLISLSLFNKKILADQSHSHEYTNGICECGEYEEAAWEQHTPTGWLVGNAGQLMWASEKYNNGEISSSIIITNNIELPDDITWVPIGNSSYPFKNNIITSDNQVFTINLNKQTVTSSNYGLIGTTSKDYLEFVDIKNIKVTGEFIISNTLSNVGAIIGLSNNQTKLENVSSFVTMSLTDSASGTTHIGGLIGNSIGELIIDASANFGNLNLDGAYEMVGGLVGFMTKGKVTSSINYGNISSQTAKYLGGLIGHVDNQEFKGMSNSANLGLITGKSFSISLNDSLETLLPGDLIGYLGNHQTHSMYVNYYLGSVAFGLSTTDTSMYASKTNQTEIESGALTYHLGNKFGQKIDVDEVEKEKMPIIGSMEVYQMFKCDGITIKYSNFPKNEDHEYKYTALGNKIIQECNNCNHLKKIELLNPTNLYFDKTLKEVSLYTDITGLDLSEIEINYSAEPIFPAVYQASITYLDLTITTEFEILKGIPTISMFTYHELDEKLVYDGNDKYLNLYHTTEPGMGEIEVKYFDGKSYLAHPKNAGLYSVNLSVKEGKYYQAYQFNNLETFKTIEISKKDVTVEWTKTTLYYEEDRNIYFPEYLIHGTCYNDIPRTQFSDSVTGIGTYTITLTVIDDNYQLVGDNQTIEFTVKKTLVTPPTIPFGIYQAGVTQKPEIADTELYKVVKNDGGISSGKHPIVLELVDTSNYTWEETSDARLTIYYHIYMLKSEWEIYPTMNDLAYGEAFVGPTYKIKYGYLDLSFTYRSINGKFSKEIPTEVGEYEVKITSETNDFRSSPLEDVILKFKINKAVPECLIDSYFKVPYGTKLSDIELLGFGEGTWNYKTNQDNVLDAGKHEVEVVFTPLNQNNYQTVTKTIQIEVEKGHVTYTEPTVIDNLVYNSNYQQLVLQGNAVNGVMMYKVNDGPWQQTIPYAKNAGTYEVFYKVEADDNYQDIDIKSVIVTIKKNNLKVIAEDLSIEQYTPIPSLKYHLEGNLEFDVLTNEPTLNVTINDTNTVGTYEISIQDAVNDNYNITYVFGTLTIYEHTTCRGGISSCSEKAKCQVCNQEYGSLKEHEFNDYQYNNDITKDHDGTMTSKCKNCNETHTITLENSKQAAITPNNLGLGILVGILSSCVVFAIVYFVIIKKKKTS